MRIIDCRSGQDHIAVGDVVKYPVTNGFDGEPLPAEWWQLLEIRDRWLWASVRILTPHGEQIVPISVRFMHPAFTFQRIGFFPS
jgi:hypothetical protein